MRVYYVCTNENGEYYINEDGEESEEELSYIRDLNLQDDVVDLNNRAAVAYNDMVDGDETLRTFLVDLNAEIDKNVGEALARAEGSKSSEEAGEAAGTETVGELLGEAQIETETPDEPVTVVTKGRATDVIGSCDEDGVAKFIHREVFGC